MKSTFNINNSNFSFLQDLYFSFLDFIPKLFLGILFILGAWLIIKITTYLLQKLLTYSKIDNLATKLNEAKIFGNADFKIIPSKIIVKFVKFLLILIFVLIASEIFGLTIISLGIGKFISYLPILISALLIFVFGIYIASIVKKSIVNSFKQMGLSKSGLVSNVIFYVIIVFVTITALNHAGVNTDIFTQNIIVFLGGFLLSTSLAIGLGSQNIVKRLILGFYTKRNFSIGQNIQIGELEGIIIKVDNINVSIKTDREIIVIPIQDFADNYIKIKE